jgi:hypothetical protein
MRRIPGFLWSGLTAIIRTGDIRLARFAVGLGCLVYAAILLLGGYQFNRPAYAAIAQWAPQWLWGFGFLLCGALLTVRSILNVPAQNDFYACTAAALNLFMWSSITFGMAISLSPTPAINTGNIVMTGLTVLILVRAVAKNG